MGILQCSRQPLKTVQQPMLMLASMALFGTSYTPAASKVSAPTFPRTIQQQAIRPAQLAFYTTDNSGLPVVERRALTAPWFNRQRQQAWQFQPPFTPTTTYAPAAARVFSQYQRRDIPQPWAFNTFTPAATTYAPPARSVAADVFKRDWQQAKPAPARLEFYTTDNSGLPVLERRVLSTNRFELRYQQTQIPNGTFGLIAQGSTYSPPSMTVRAQINSQRVSMDSIQLALYMINDGYFPVAQQVSAQINPRAFTFHPLPLSSYTAPAATAYSPVARIVAAQQNAVRDTPTFMQLASYLIADYTSPSSVVLAQINRTPFVTHVPPTLTYGGALTSYAPPAVVIPAQINRVPFVTHPQPALVYGGTLTPYVSPPVVAVAANPLLPEFQNSGFFQVAHYDLYTTELAPPVDAGPALGPIGPISPMSRHIGYDKPKPKKRKRLEPETIAQEIVEELPAVVLKPKFDPTALNALQVDLEDIKAQMKAKALNDADQEAIEALFILLALE